MSATGVGAFWFNPSIAHQALRSSKHVFSLAVQPAWKIRGISRLCAASAALPRLPRRQPRRSVRAGSRTGGSPASYSPCRRPIMSSNRRHCSIARRSPVAALGYGWAYRSFQPLGEHRVGLRRRVGLRDSPSGLALLCLGGRDVVVEAEEVVRVVAPLHLPQPLEVRISVGCAHAFDGLIRSSVVEVAAAARRALLERGGRAPRPGDVVGVTWPRPPRWPLRSR